MQKGRGEIVKNSMFCNKQCKDRYNLNTNKYSSTKVQNSKNDCLRI